MTAKNTALSLKEQFLAAPKFAVVGASTNTSKHGYKAVKWLVDQHKDVVPITPKYSEILDIKCLQNLSQLPDPTKTAVFVIVRPEIALQILETAKTLNIFSLWLQPGAADDAVVKLIQADPQLTDRCIYNIPAPSLATSTTLPAMLEKAARVQPAVNTNSIPPSVHTDTSPVCSGLWDNDAASAQASPMVNLALNTKLASGPTTDTGPVCSGLLDDDITSPKLAPVVQFAAIGTAQSVPTFDEQKALFFSAFHFAVVGASTDKNKYGFKTLKRLIDLRKDVVPVNPTATEILGIKCIKSLSDLPEPTLTAVSVVCKPQVTLAILKEAKSLNILALWLQPGAEDDAVVEFIEADAQLMERCIYQKRPLHSSAVHTAPCLLTATAHLMPPTPVAGQKHAILSPPSTPPAAKSLKLSAESTASPRKIADSVADLSQEIPGLA